MKLLQINWEDPGVFAVIDVASDADIDQDTLQSVDENVLDLIKCDSEGFHRAVIESEEDEDGEEITYSISKWEKLV